MSSILKLPVSPRTAILAPSLPSATSAPWRSECRSSGSRSVRDHLWQTGFACVRLILTVFLGNPSRPMVQTIWPELGTGWCWSYLDISVVKVVFSVYPQFADKLRKVPFYGIAAVGLVQIHRQHKWICFVLYSIQISLNIHSLSLYVHISHTHIYTYIIVYYMPYRSVCLAGCLSVCLSIYSNTGHIVIVILWCL